MAMRNEELVLDAIDGEFEYQNKRWGAAKMQRSQDEWIAYINDYAREALTQTTRGEEEAALHTVRKIAAMCIRCMIQHGILRRLGF